MIGTGQHRDLVDPVLQLFGMTLDHDLQIMRADATLNMVLSRAIARLGEALERLDRMSWWSRATRRARSAARLRRNCGIPVAQSRPGCVHTTSRCRIPRRCIGA